MSAMSAWVRSAFRLALTGLITHWMVLTGWTAGRGAGDAVGIRRVRVDEYVLGWERGSVHQVRVHELALRVHSKPDCLTCNDCSIFSGTGSPRLPISATYASRLLHAKRGF